MNFKFTNKKVVLILVLILLLFIGGVFLWRTREEPFKEWRSQYSPKEDYVVIETPDGKILKNEKMGLKVGIPDGWKLDERWEGGLVGNIILTSQDFERQPGNNPFKKGCLIEIGIADYGKYETVETETIKDFIEMCKAEPEQLKKDGYEYVKIDEYEALKTTTPNKPETERFISVRVLIDNKVYSFSTPLYSENKERCAQEFDEFLETVSINR